MLIYHIFVKPYTFAMYLTWQCGKDIKCYQTDRFWWCLFKGRAVCSLSVIWPEAKLCWRWWRYWWPASKCPMQALLHSVPPTLQQATTDPRLCWRLLDTHRQVWVQRVAPWSAWILEWLWEAETPGQPTMSLKCEQVIKHGSWNPKAWSLIGDCSVA